MKIKTRVAFPALFLSLLLIYIIQLLSSNSVNSSPGIVVKSDEFSNVGLVQAQKPQAKDLTESDIESMVNQAVENAGGFQNVIKPGGTVVIKVNLVDTMKDSLEKEVNGVTVDWRVTRAVVKLALAAGAGEVFIIEGSVRPTKEVFQYMNYHSIEEIPEDHLIALEEDVKTNGKLDYTKLERFEIKDGLIKRVYYVDKRLLDADVFISIAALKTHRRIAITGSVKNIGIGCFPAPLNPNPITQDSYPNDRGGFINHRPVPLSQWITDYYSLIPAQFAIIDGLQGAQNGPLPVNADDRHMNMRTIIAGKDPVAVDTVAGLVMGIDPDSALYLKMLDKKGFGNSDPARIRVIGDGVGKVRKFFKTMYGESIPQKRHLDIEIANKLKENEGMRVRFNIASSHETARIELIVDDSVQEVFDKNTREIVIDSSLLKSKLSLKVYNIYLDEDEVKIEEGDGQ